MLKKALRLLLSDPKGFYGLAKLKLLGQCCRLVNRSGFYFQGKMDIDPKSWWHNPEFVSASGGYFLPGDPVSRQVLPLEPWDMVRRDLILLLLRDLTARRVEGDLAELGVYRGYSARLIHHYLPERKLYLFDTFAGFDERDVRAEQAKTGRATGCHDFSQTGVELALKNIAPQNENVQLYPGYFPESAPEAVRQSKFAFIHLDADLYEPMLAGLSYFYDKVVPGGYILAHDFNSWPGARQAVQEFFKGKPEIPIPMPDKSGSALILKLGPRPG